MVDEIIPLPIVEEISHPVERVHHFPREDIIHDTERVHHRSRADIVHPEERVHHM